VKNECGLRCSKRFEVLEQLSEHARGVLSEDQVVRRNAFGNARDGVSL
jgi:hypothetical protein